MLGGFVIAHIARRFRDDRLMSACLIILGVGVVGIAVLQNYPLTLAIMILGGPAVVGLNTTFITMLQRNSEDQFRGRIFSLLGAFSGVIFLVSTVIGSAATKVMSPPTILLISGLIYAVARIGNRVAPRCRQARCPGSGSRESGPTWDRRDCANRLMLGAPPYTGNRT